ncbi:glycosyl hydrolase [Clostridium autoethanogenum]|uniref:Glycosyl hydrolase n=1 Tax=Clostridium autoethanogenum TaxID=84023 RepID=A0A3M0SVB7_9CLOT|nr:glycoside hydrolase family 3 C-terminal domain-containing protein [Clostridium autoethanogenum]RMD02394.1 glycosyl hydrolase [Clostridium autoethanogenum]
MLTKESRSKYDEEAKEVVAKLTLEEKVHLMSGSVTFDDMIEDLDAHNKNKHYNWKVYEAGGNEQMGIPKLGFCDGPRGIVTGQSTCFPVTVARGATFNKELEEKVGIAIAQEIRGYGGNFYGGVCINMPYSPGWGRSQETYGEDSCHLGAMGSSLVKGIQSQGVIACIKHFAFNSMENARFKVSVTADKRTEREIFLSHFKDCIDAGAAGVMTAYNSYKGDHCGENSYLIDILRKEWGYDGIIVSDFGWGIYDTVKAANAGMNVEMCNTSVFGRKLVKAVQDGKVSEKVVDDAAVNIVRTLLAFKKHPDPINYTKENLIANDEHINLAKNVARESCTLIKNEGILPLDNSKDQKILILGRLAGIANLGDHGSSEVFPPYTVTIKDGLTAKAKGKVEFYDGKDIEKAKKLALDYDKVIFVVGYDYRNEGEYIEEGTFKIGGDRKNGFGLEQHDKDLIEQVSKVNSENATLVVSGSMITVDEWGDHTKAIMYTYYSGMEGGSAIAEILFGDVNPSGKLPFVIPEDENDLPKVDWTAEEQKYEYYHGYMRLEKYNKVCKYPYGFGLSYTKFNISQPEIEVKSDSIVASCVVTNIGSRKGKEVVQLYIGYDNSKVDRPIKALRGFEKVELYPGETKTVKIICPVDKLKYYEEKENKWVLESMIYQGYVGSSSDKKDLFEVDFEI